MSDTKVIQVVTDGTVTNAILVPADAMVEAGGSRAAWINGGYAAPAGSKLVDQDGAGIGWTVSGNTLVAPPAPPDPPAAPPQLFTYKVDLFRRATEDEAEKIDAALAQSSARMRRLFDGAARLDHDAEEFLVVQTAAIDIFGQSRADVLLAPSG